MKAWLQLIRWSNLLMVGLAQFLFKYAFLPAFGISSLMNVYDITLLCISVICMTASGNIINDVFDVERDLINQRSRPLAQLKIRTNQAYMAYYIFNLIAIGLISYLSLKLTTYSLIVIVLAVIGLLFLYSKYLKSVPILGNIFISVFVSLSFLLVPYAELLALEQKIISNEVMFWLVGYGGFAFWVNLNREWIKDVMNIKGDYAQRILTLPILLGKTRMNMLIFTSTLLLVLALIAGVKIYFQLDLFFTLYLTFGISVPLFFVLFHIHQKQLNTNYELLSHIYRIVMLMGIFSLILFKL